MTRHDQPCFDRVPPFELREVSREMAIRENPDNRPSPLEAVAFTSKLWRAGCTLRVRFLDGDPNVQTRVRHHAQEWTRHANVNFSFGDDRNADIRISFTPDEGSWSAVGTDALIEDLYPTGTPTMNYGWLTPESTEDEYSEVVLHEFGHALGMIHEHQNPQHRIRWNKEAIYRALAQPPNEWDQATVDRNFFEVYDRTQTQFTAFDSKSIMLYKLPAEWTQDGIEFPRNVRLSGEDKRFIAARYPVGS
jgi:hypothetical protein